jgi:hypothetical protein
MSYLELTDDDLNATRKELDAPRIILGQWVHISILSY